MENNLTPPINYSTRNTCRICQNKILHKRVPLNPLPVQSPNVKTDKIIFEKAPADVWQCENCGLLQLTSIVEPKFQYDNFQYLSQISKGLLEHFRKLINQLQKNGLVGKDKFVLDIGSNDGSLLLMAKEKGAKVLGIDPAKDPAALAIASGVPTIVDFFTHTTVDEVLQLYPKPDVIISNNTVANLDDLHSFFSNIKKLLDNQGVLIIETQYAADVIEKCLLDVIYHEHLNYFSLKPLKFLLKMHELKIDNVECISPKGGSIRFYIRHIEYKTEQTFNNLAHLEKIEQKALLYDQKGFEKLNIFVAELSEKLSKKITDEKHNFGKASGWGSSVGCAAVMHYCNITELLDVVFDDTPLNPYIIGNEKIINVLSGE